MTVLRITRADIDLAKLVIRAAESIGKDVDPGIRILAEAAPTEVRMSDEEAAELTASIG